MESIEIRECPKCRKLTMRPWGLNGRGQALFACINEDCPIGGPSPLGVTQEDINVLMSRELGKEAA